MTTYFVKKAQTLKTHSNDLLTSLLADVDQNEIELESTTNLIVNFLTKPRYSTPEGLVIQNIQKFYEKFRADNFLEEANLLQQQCQAIIVNESTRQFGASILDLLFSLSHRPTDPRRRYEVIGILTKQIEIENEQKQREANLLIKPKHDNYTFDMNIELAVSVDGNNDAESDLSDWSVSDTVEEPLSSKGKLKARSPRAKTTLPNIQSPRQPLPYCLYDNEMEFVDKICKQIQPAWWLQQSTNRHTMPESKTLETQFARAFQSFLIKSMKFSSEEVNIFQHYSAGEAADDWRCLIYKENMVKLCTIDEYCLLREILWMFVAPVTCKFFVKSDHIIMCQDNVTIPSVTRIALSNFLNNQFVPAMNMMSNMQTFIKSIFASEDMLMTHTLQSYAADLHLFLKPILADIQNFENRLMQPATMQINTLITMQASLGKCFENLKYLHNIHNEVMPLSLPHCSGHIISDTILTNLLNVCHLATTSKDTNLSLALLLSSLKSYCKILDTWWYSGHLYDDYNEFLIKHREHGELGKYSARSYRKAAQHVSVELLCQLEESNLLDLLKNHCLGIADTLTVLYNINCKKLLNFEAFDEPSLYEQLLNKIFDYVQAFQDNPNYASGLSDINDTHHTMPKSELIHTLAIHDDLLFMCFADENDMRPSTNTLAELNAFEIFIYLEQTNATLALEQVVLDSLANILDKRAAKAHGLFIQLYLHEYCLFEHLQNISRVFLLKESYILLGFYQEIFLRLNQEDFEYAGSELTEKLQKCLGYYYPKIAELFYVQVDGGNANSYSTMPYEAIDSVSLCYSLNYELSQLITSTNLDAYNKLFHFLLKLKLCIHTLDNLHFCHIQRKRDPYAPHLMPELVMRRLQQLRFWFMFAIQNLHFHITACVLPPLAMKLEKNLCNCKTLKELEATQRQYIAALLGQCFLTNRTAPIRFAIIELFNLTECLSQTWKSCVGYTNGCILRWDNITSGTTEWPIREISTSVSCIAAESQSSETIISDSNFKNNFPTSASTSTNSSLSFLNNFCGDETTSECRSLNRTYIEEADNCFFIEVLEEKVVNLNKNFFKWYQHFVQLLKNEVHEKQNYRLDGLYDIFRTNKT